jgi:hypothetical protein
MSSPELFIALVAVTTVAVAWMWRTWHRKRRQQAIDNALATGTREEVDEALDLIRRVGLTDHAGALLTLVDRRPPPDLTRALIELVAGHQWEPVSTEDVKKLRTWASEAATQVPAPEKQRRRSDREPGIDSPLVDRVEKALGEPVTWMYAETDEGSLLVDRNEDEEPNLWA